MYNKILAPLDGSTFSECTLNHIKAIATGCHVSQVVLLIVLESSGQFISSSFQIISQENVEKITEEKQKVEKNIEQKAQEYLTKVANNLSKDGVQVQTVVMKAKEPTEGILDYSQSNDIDLIILSTHGRSGVSRWALGSVADRVIRHSKVPVLAVTPAGCR